MLDSLVSGIFNGNARSISRAITIVENDGDSDTVRNLIRDIFPRTGNAHIVGITGPPGIGKSTMIGRICSLLSEQGKKVSVVAIDASSPFTGGSLLGNRIRMQESLTKHGVFMRSLANRGLTGGLSRSIWDTVKILDAAGSDYIIVETVGAGQADLDISNLADTVVVVLGPGLGDEIQAIKAGIMEIGNIFVINKMDRQGAYIAMKDIEETLAMMPRGEWKPPVVGLNSMNGEGYDKLLDLIDRHRAFSLNHPEVRMRKFRKELQMHIDEELRRRFRKDISGILQDDSRIRRYLEDHVDPYSAAEGIVEEIA